MSRKVFIGPKTHDRINTGRAVVGATVSALSASGAQLEGGVQLTAGPANAGIVYVGTRDNLTPGNATDTDGYPLSAGDTVFLPVSSEDKVKAIASVADQDLFFASY